MNYGAFIWIALTAGLAALPGGAAGPTAAAAVATSELQLLPLNATQARGRDFAARRCGGCHNTGLDDGPPYEGPSFRNLAIRYDARVLERRFAEVSAHGFDRMPPISFTPAEADDLSAYFKSLQRKP